MTCPPPPVPSPPLSRLRFATVWLAGCSGCHMSFLDLDEFLFDLAEQVEVVYSPVASDAKHYPEAVDLVLVEGAVANADNLTLARQVRERSRWVVAFGDCAVSANVPGMRNLWNGPEPVLSRGYLELADHGGQLPCAPGIVPELLEQVLPLHQVIAVDLWLPGCPPSAARIKAALLPLLAGELPQLEGAQMLRFG
ncbi:MAG: oxidoreductase [Cyanobacteriota bacterium]|jgi:NAD-reducing hydrogenase small subunit